MRRMPILMTLLALLLSAPQVSATPTWKLGAEVVTDFPIQVGASLMVETPKRLRLYTSLGVMPKPYLDTINAICTGAGWYDEMTANLISAALENALVWRLKVGWRPLADKGFYVGAGYGLATLGGGLSGAELVTTLTDKSVPNTKGRTLSVAAVVHMVDIELGWEWRLYKGLMLRAALGGTFTADSTTTIKPSWTPTKIAQPAIEDLARAGEAYLDDIIKTYVHTLTVSLALGWRF